MTRSDPLITFFDEMTASLADGTFVKFSCGHYTGDEPDLKKIIARRVVIKRADKLSFTYTYKTRDIVKNFDVVPGVDLLRDALRNGFKTATLFTTQNDTVLTIGPEGKIKIVQNPPTQTTPASLEHDQTKERMIAGPRVYLHDLGVMDANGNVLKSAQDKFRQINKYIEILDGLIADLPPRDVVRVVDMGAGKGYLTFALYDHLVNNRGQKAAVVGIEYRPDMVDLCNKIAAKNGFSDLRFVQGSIENYDAGHVDILIALHACDTATDDAIAKGIDANADLIVVAPCCHKQIRREMETGRAKNDLDFLTRYGTFLERQAEMVTDGIRALILNYRGYSTKVFEFISDAHTPKNVLIVGQKNQKLKPRDAGILQKITEAKKYFGITRHHLEKIIDIKSP